MKTDRELLEAAAKAHGNIEWVDHGVYGSFWWDNDSDEMWLPLKDDGNALRLAVKLKLNIQHHDEGYVVVWHGRKHGLKEDYGNDPNAATRRAITRAAAEIGENK